MLPPPEREGAGAVVPLSQVRDGRRAGSRVLVLEGVVGAAIRSGRVVVDLPGSAAGRRKGLASGIKLAGFRIILGAPGVDVFMEPEDIDGRCE